MKEFRDLQMKCIDTTEMEEKRQARHLDCMRCMHAMEYESGTAGIMVRVCVCVLVDVVFVFTHGGCYIEMCMYIMILQRTRCRF